VKKYLHANRCSSATIRPKARASRRQPISFETPQKFFNIADRKTYSVKFDKDAILKTASDSDSYHIRNHKLRNLPKFDNCRPYIDKPTEINKLLADEVDKLIEFAELDQPPVFNSHGCLRGADRTDFEELSNLADQIACISDVLTHDNSRHGVVFGTYVADEAWDTLLSSRCSLQIRYATDEKHREGGRPVTLEDCGQPERNSRALHVLLDYILNIMAWWLVRCADSEYWRTQILATLAQQAVKMKVICRNPARCAESSLSETSGMIEQLKIEADMNDVLIKIGGEKKDPYPLQTQKDYLNLYIEEKLWIREALNGILGQVLAALVRDDESNEPSGFSEICTMIFRRDTEPDRSGKIWTGLRHGDVGVSSSLLHISFCYSLTNLLNLHINAMKLAERTPQPPIAEHIKLSGNINENDTTTKHTLQIYSMDDVVTLLIPLLLMQPLAVKPVRKLMNTAMAFMNASEVLRVFTPPPLDFALELTLSTRAWLHDSKTSQVLDPDVTSLSQSPLNRKFVCNTTTCTRVSSANAVEQIHPIHKRRDQPKWHVYETITLRSTTTW
jgi:hypothetical protein